MKKKRNKIFYKIILFTTCLFLTILVSFFAFFIKTTAGVSLDKNKLAKAQNKTQIKVFDGAQNQIDNSAFFYDKVMVDIKSLPDHVKWAFIVTEDKRFYKHKGIDVIRMMGATLSNIKQGKLSEGASTISQQLIKNTHLSQEKTLQRKLKEIKLSLALENRFSKDEILSLYLNNIYFGNGCYGIESAAKHYFGVSASELTIGQSSMLAGVIKAPTHYDPINKQENAEQRKRVVLSLLLKEGKITPEEQKNAKSFEKIKKTASKQTNLAYKTIISEACSILKITENQLKNMNISIQTSIDFNLQNSIDSLINSSDLNQKINNSSAVLGAIVIDNKAKNVVAFSSNKNINLLKSKRQPGSAIKPILVYAPALEYGIIYPESIVSDEPINVNGYSPNNASKTYMGDVSVKVAVEKSLNIPAVRILSNLGVQRGKKFAENMGISFTENDQDLALALGGFNKGVSIKELADAYSTFASDGEFAKSDFITKITDENGKILYEKSHNKKRVMSSATAYLMTDILKGVTTNGTAKRLDNLGFEVASKTGTVGDKNSNKNTDCYCVSYTTDHTIICYTGSLNNENLLDASINGSSYPALLNRLILEKLYESNQPQNFEMPDSVEQLCIDTRSLEHKKVELASDFVPEKFQKTALFNKKYLPENSRFLSPHKVNLFVETRENIKPTLTFETQKNNEYVIYRKDISTQKTKNLIKINGNNSLVSYTDYSAEREKIYEYYVMSNIENNQDIYEKSNSIKLISY